MHPRALACSSRPHTRDFELVLFLSSDEDRRPRRLGPDLHQQGMRARRGTLAALPAPSRLAYAAIGAGPNCGGGAARAARRPRWSLLFPVPELRYGGGPCLAGAAQCAARAIRPVRRQTATASPASLAVAVQWIKLRSRSSVRRSRVYKM